MEIKEETWEVLNTVWLPEDPKSHNRKQAVGQRGAVTVGSRVRARGLAV